MAIATARALPRQLRPGMDATYSTRDSRWHGRSPVRRRIARFSWPDQPSNEGPRFAGGRCFLVAGSDLAGQTRLLEAGRTGILRRARS